MLYFAYGPNMNTETLAAREVRFEKVCTGKVRDMRLVFRKPGEDGSGKADLEDARGAVTEGVVYDVAEGALANLDLYEGVDRGHYQRQRAMVQTSRGELECDVYRATKFRDGLKPTAAYLGEIIRGAEEHRLSASYLTFLKSHLTSD
jgi:gamma-glutamylcyclotransferase